MNVEEKGDKSPAEKRMTKFGCNSGRKRRGMIN